MSDTVNKSTDFVTGLIYAGIFLAVMLLAVTVTIGALQMANVSANGNVSTIVSVVNETGFANQTGYTVSGAKLGYTDFSMYTITAIYNKTDGTAVSPANITFTSSGIVRNATVQVWNNLSLSYGYTHDTTQGTQTWVGLNTITAGVLGIVGNFFALAPTIGTIFAVVILIAGIVILVLYVRKMKGEDKVEGFQG